VSSLPNAARSCRASSCSSESGATTTSGTGDTSTSTSAPAHKIEEDPSERATCYGAWPRHTSSLRTMKADVVATARLRQRPRPSRRMSLKCPTAQEAPPRVASQSHDRRSRSEPSPFERPWPGIGYLAVRNSIVNQQLASMRHQALANAVLLRGECRVPRRTSRPDHHARLRPDTDSLIYSSEHWVPSSATLSPRNYLSPKDPNVLRGHGGCRSSGSSGSPSSSSGVPITRPTASRTENAATSRSSTCRTSPDSARTVGRPRLAR